MGADFLMYSAPKCQLTPERLSLAQGAIQGMTDRQILSSLEAFEGLTYAEEDQAEGCAEYRQQLLKDLEFYSDPCGPEVIDWTPPGCDRGFYFTGGMSWGDSPTEAADIFRRLSSCPKLWRLLDRWAVADERQRRAKVRWQRRKR